MNKAVEIFQQILLISLFVIVLPIKAIAGVPSVSDLIVTDVTTRSFSVVWASSEASLSNLNIYDDADGLNPTIGAVITSQPVSSGNTSIAVLAEDNGVMKVRVTGLIANTTYYFQTITISKSTSDVVLNPDINPLFSVTTETKEVRTLISGVDETPFTNDLIALDCYLADGVTPAEGTLLVAEVAGGDYPVSGFVGDDVAIPYAYVDLNNIFDVLSYETMPLYGDESLTLTKFMGFGGMETINYMIPINDQLGEMKSPVSILGCPGDLNGDGDRDGSDLAAFASALTNNLPEADLNGNVVIDAGDLQIFAENFGVGCL